MRNEKAINQIDLEKKFHIDKVSLFLEFDDEWRQPAVSIPEIGERLFNSCHFAGRISVEESAGMRCGLVRASISELVSIEELPSVIELNWGKPFRLSSTNHPLLCIVKELRNVQMHLSSIKMNEFEKNMLLGNPTKPDESKRVVKKICFIDNLSVDQFTPLKNYTRYSPVDFHNALKWFDEEQKRWGISELLFQAAYVYAEYLSQRINSKLD